MLIDDVLPTYDFSERRAAAIAADATQVRRALEEWRPADSLPWRLLLVLRGLGRPGGTLRQWAEATGFLCLAEDDDEIVFGQAGRFWELRERRAIASPRSLDEFLRFEDARSAVAVMNFRIVATGPRQTRLLTETRVRTLSAHAHRRFRIYWLLIRPFSGLLRRAMLRGVANAAERSSALPEGVER